MLVKFKLEGYRPTVETEEDKIKFENWAKKIISRVHTGDPVWTLSDKMKWGLDNYYSFDGTILLEDIVDCPLAVTIEHVVDRSLTRAKPFVRELTRRHKEVAVNDRTNVAVMQEHNLMRIDKVKIETNCCTDRLQDLLDDGWRILAICVQPNQRRPDYVLGLSDKSSKLTDKDLDKLGEMMERLLHNEKDATVERIGITTNEIVTAYTVKPLVKHDLDDDVPF